MPEPATAPRIASPTPYVIWGLLVVLLAVGGLGTWSLVAPLRSAVIAPGVITVLSNRKTVQHLEGGIVSEILVRDGDRVERGAPLLRLDPTQVQAALAIVDGQLDILRAREARLLAERDGAAAPTFPEALDARRGDPNVGEILRGEARLFEARRNALEGEVEILTQRAVQLREEIGGLEAQQRSKQRQIEILRRELDGLHELFERGYASRVRINELERAREELEGELGEYVAAIARAQTGIGESRLRAIQLRKEFRGEVVRELHETQSRVFELAERRIAAVDRLARLEIRAPQAGTVVGLGVHTVGGVVGPGEPLLDIVPEGDELIVEARVQPQDIDRVTLAQTAVVRLSAFDRRSTPELRGEVITASADRMTDRATGESYYLVRCRIPKLELERLGELRLVPGMPAETFIQTGERTLASYLLKPITDGLARSLRDR